MASLITCPHCGPRAEIEFRCGGEAHIARPADPFALATLPHDQPLVLRLEGEGSVRRIEGSLTREGEREPARGFTLSFERGAPSRVRHTVSLPNGRYLLDLAVVHDGSPTETRVERRVSLAGEEVVIPVTLSP